MMTNGITKRFLRKVASPRIFARYVEGYKYVKRNPASEKISIKNCAMFTPWKMNNGKLTLPMVHKPAATIGVNSRLGSSIIGPNVNIGSDCIIVGACIEEGVTIGRGAGIYFTGIGQRILIRKGLKIGDNAKINADSPLLDFGKINIESDVSDFYAYMVREQTHGRAKSDADKSARKIVINIFGNANKFDDLKSAVDFLESIQDDNAILLEAHDQLGSAISTLVSAFKIKPELTTASDAFVI